MGPNPRYNVNGPLLRSMILNSSRILVLLFDVTCRVRTNSNGAVTNDAKVREIGPAISGMYNGN